MARRICRECVHSMSYSDYQLEEIGARLVLAAAGYGTRYCRVPQGDGPDFQLLDAPSSTGLEVTLLQREDDHSGRMRRAMEGSREQFLRGLDTWWAERRLPRVHARVSFSGHLAPTKHTLADDITRVGEYVVARLPSEGVTASLEVDWLDPQALPSYVARISLWRSHSLPQSYWSGTDASFVPDLTRSDVQSCIDRKSKKLRLYRQLTPAVWLGIVLDGFRPSGHFTVTDAVLSSTFSGHFDRVFLIDAFHGKATPLICRPAGADA